MRCEHVAASDVVAMHDNGSRPWTKWLGGRTTLSTRMSGRGHTQPRPPTQHDALSLSSHPSTPLVQRLPLPTACRSPLLLSFHLLLLSSVGCQEVPPPPVQHHVYYGSHVTSIAVNGVTIDVYVNELVHNRVTHYNSSGSAQAV